MITPSFALTATERVLPRMALDFTTASLDSRVTFTRTGNIASVTNSSGYVAQINANLPRFDYDPVTLACKGLLIEESRTNLMLYSDDLSAVAWTPQFCSVLTAQTTSPNGLTNSNKIREDSANNVHRVYQGAVGIGAMSASIYAKAGERTVISLLLFNVVNGGIADTTFNLSTGAIQTTTTGTATITNAGNGWYRCTVSAVSTVDTQLYVSLTNNGSVVYQGDGTSGAYVWRAQNELGAFATSSIPTTVSQVTRTADVAVMTGTNFSDWYTATTGAAVVWSTPQTATGVRPLIQFDDATALKIITLRGNIADPELYVVDTVAQAQIDAGTIVANTTYKLSGAWNTNNCAAAKDGGTVGTDVVATIPAPTQLRIGSDGTNYACSWVQKIMYWKQRIINAEVQAFSK